MRKIISISLSENDAIQLKERAKKRGKSISKYIQELLKMEESLISEEELLERAKRAEQNHTEGKTKVLTSLRELL